MELELPSVASDNYHSTSQRVRVATESWAVRNLFCPHCGRKLKPYPTGMKVRDFFCSDCGEAFQLKASNRPFADSFIDGEYETTLRSVEEGLFPSLLLLRYDLPSWSVEDTFAVHRAWITPRCVEPRKRLSKMAQRAGYQGCILRLDLMPQLARIVIIRNGRVMTRERCPAALVGFSEGPRCQHGQAGMALRHRQVCGASEPHFLDRRYLWLQGGIEQGAPRKPPR